MKNKLILASSSPRRLELLGQIGIVPEKIIPADIDESMLKGELPRDLAKRLADAKGAKVTTENPGHFVLSADTVVACGRRLMDKPKDADDARRILTLLSGRRHKVYGGICVINPTGKSFSRLCETVVSFKRLSPAEIDSYIDGGDWEGKAGAYAIQGIAGTYVKFLSGSHSNVIGLSLYDTMRLLESSGFIQKQD